MFVRNLLRPSDFVTLVPVGMPTTLQYNDKGMLEKVYWGYTPESREDLSSRMLSAAKITDEVKPFPFKIPLKEGTTWIMGVLYSDIGYNNSQGILPNCIHDEFLDMFDENPGQFHFFAGCVESLATQFKGAANIRRWLDMSGFDVLPGFLAPAQITEESFTQCVEHCQYNLQYPKIVSYIIFRGTEVLYVDTNLIQHIVATSSRYTDTSGHIKAKLTLKDGYDPLYVDYSDLVSFDIKANTMITEDASRRIIATHVTDDKKRDKHSKTITCKYCGMSFALPETGLVKCPNESCLSHQYPKLSKMLRAFGLPEIVFQSYEKAVADKEILTLLDILDTGVYAESEIKTSLGKVLEAVVPVSVCSDTQMFTTFANQCNNNIQTFIFYIQHPDKIVINLNISSPHLQKFVNWLSDVMNAEEIVAILNHPRISIATVDKRFNGSPIFRNKVIMITGKFRHGDNGEIISILQSYSATVVNRLSDDVQCLVVGDIPEDVNGAAIRKCRQTNIPVFTEKEFFEKFQIDEDLAENLL